MTSLRASLLVLALAAAMQLAMAADGEPKQGIAVAVARSAAQPVMSPEQPKTAGTKKAAADLKLLGMDGDKHSLAEWEGKVVVLNFWATWCSPCLVEIRDLVAYQNHYNRRGLQVVGVGLDEERKLRNVQRTMDINYPILIAAPKNYDSLLKSWGNDSGIVPYSVVLDRKGRVAYTFHGQINQEIFDENILPLLSKD